MRTTLENRWMRDNRFKDKCLFFRPHYRRERKAEWREERVMDKESKVDSLC